MMAQFKFSNLAASALAGLAVLAFLAGGAAPALADKPSAEQMKLARDYLKLTHQLASAEDIAKVVGQQFTRKKPELKLDIQDAVEQVAPQYEKDVQAMNDEVAEVYASHFSQDELQSMVDFYTKFYDTPAGKKLDKEWDAISDEMAEISRLRGVLIGGEISQAIYDKLGEIQRAKDAEHRERN